MHPVERLSRSRSTRAAAPTPRRAKPPSTQQSRSRKSRPLHDEDVAEERSEYLELSPNPLDLFGAEGPFPGNLLGLDDGALAPQNDDRLPRVRGRREACLALGDVDGSLVVLGDRNLILRALDRDAYELGLHLEQAPGLGEDRPAREPEATDPDEAVRRHDHPGLVRELDHR